MLNKVLPDLIRPVVVAPLPSELNISPASVSGSIPWRRVSHPTVILAEITWASHLGHVRAHAARTGLVRRSSKGICSLVIAESASKRIGDYQTGSLPPADRRRARLNITNQAAQRAVRISAPVS